MAKHRQTWRPDTCGCVLMEVYDSDLPPGKRFTGDAVIVACPAHQGIVDPAEHYERVLQENQSKNVFVNAVATALGWSAPAVDEFGIERSPEINPEFAPTRIPYAYDAQRAVMVDLVDLHQATKASQAALDASVTAGLDAVAAFRQAGKR